jgi:hypothetical protein
MSEGKIIEIYNQGISQVIGVSNFRYDIERYINILISNYFFQHKEYPSKKIY